jgi:hypothetical protein
VIVEQRKQFRLLEYQLHQTYIQHPKTIEQKQVISMKLKESLTTISKLSMKVLRLFFQCRATRFLLTCFFNASAISWAPPASASSDDFSGAPPTEVFEEAAIFYVYKKNISFLS